jgi:hypothetical protein
MNGGDEATCAYMGRDLRLTALIAASTVRVVKRRPSGDSKVIARNPNFSRRTNAKLSASPAGLVGAFMPPPADHHQR